MGATTQKTTKPTSKTRGRPQFDAAKAATAMRGKRAYTDFIAERRVEVCSAKDPKAFAADPGKFGYSAERCYVKGAKGAKSADTVASASARSKASVSKADDNDIRAIQAIMDTQYPRIKNSHNIMSRTPRDEETVSHDTILRLTTLMLLPLYRNKFPDPDKRYIHIHKEFKIPKNPRYRVMSSLIMFLKASNASPTAGSVTIAKQTRTRTITR
jgi:hypothetical protein